MLLKGGPVAEVIKNEIIDMIRGRKAGGLSAPKIAIIRVGQDPDDIAYESRIVKNCQTIGLLTEVNVLDESTDMAKLLVLLEQLNNRAEVHGIIVFRPLPSQLNLKIISEAIKPEKDIDSMSPVNLAKVFSGDKSALAPCTAEAVVELLKFYYGNLEGKNIVIVNRSLVLGKPLAMLLLSENATVTLCHSKTKNLAEVTSKADVVVTGIGKAKFFGDEYFSENSIVIDVGINFTGNKMYGDVDFEPVEHMVKDITPVPGGIGTVTSMILLRNVIKGIGLQKG
ncbi:MAG TPA: bifunctional 5,10-methylenetetrahydrofolate dehydrogenase/5,10-methenyltetrahydrofolate cyclohydrolase [Anaerovoracaceae bacterium]|nr:bifunctional 5,10-methylenetetrahydrofolate dehydrogenase/5,10-methenyltetrahydrofolate cyclohydrolase [Anaerovoracaceae bacterium]